MTCAAVQTRNVSSLLAELKACGILKCLERGRSVHEAARQSGDDLNVYVANTLISMYAKCGKIVDARSVFDSIRDPTVVSWNALILGYADNREGKVALELFLRMRNEGFTPDTVTFVAAFQACTDLATNVAILPSRETGRQLHLLASAGGCDLELYSGNTLVDMYAKCRSLKDACTAFANMRERNVASWTALILGHVDNGEAVAALGIFARMKREQCAPNDRTFVAVLKACADLAVADDEQFMEVSCSDRGKALHLLASTSGHDSDVYVRGTLLDLYSKCGEMDAARSVFDAITKPNVVCWNTLIMGYAENGEGENALKSFSSMRRAQCAPDAATYIAVLKACGLMGALEFGKSVYCEICSGGLDQDAVVATCIVDFFAKCGSLVEAKQVFDNATKELITWTALMTGYSRHGESDTVFDLFSAMVDAGVQPDRVTFLCLLTSCSHAGLVGKGIEYFKSMSTRFGVPCEMEHITSMVCILGRANKLDECMALLKRLPVAPNTVIWMTVLGACRKWKNVQLGRLAFDSLEDKNAPAYVIMANIYGSKGMWRDQEELQVTRKKLGVWKTPGQSCWTDRAGVVNAFLAGDRRHPQTEEMNKKWDDLLVKMRDHGYVADLSSITCNISDGNKENALYGHSEKLAIVCALINTGPGETIRIIKNLRICDDCHVATSLISKLEQRTIICRDVNRFHVFEGGKCSCGDFW